MFSLQRLLNSIAKVMRIRKYIQYIWIKHTGKKACNAIMIA